MNRLTRDARARELEREFPAWLASRPPAEGARAELDTEARERLRALGDAP